MKNIFVLAFLSLLSVSCASQANKDVKEEAASIRPTISPRTQFARAIAMVDSNPDLNQDQKERLVKLIEDYSQKMIENRLKQSQYRTVLLDEMLKTDMETGPLIAAAKKDITDLNKESSKYLESFVTDFKSIIGKSAHHHQPELLEVILVE